MKEKTPSLQEWKNLYEMAVRFRDLECWTWMEDADMFGVQDPASREIAYCCVLGALGQVFGLLAYLGSEGLKTYLELRALGGQTLTGPTQESIERFLNQKCLSLSFESRADLQKADLDVIKAIGLKFRGQKAWPLFRSLRPGYHPWYLTQEEAVFLTVALEQAMDVALRFKEDPDLLTPPEEGQYLVRVPERQAEVWIWQDEWIEPVLEEEEIGIPPMDQSRLQKLKGISAHRYGIWEVDFFYMPQPVQDKPGERPYYPYTFLWVDSQSGMILHSHLVRPSPELPEFAEQLLQLMERMEGLPSQIQVSREKAFLLLEPIASELDIELHYTKRLPALERAKASLLSFLGI